MDVDGMVEGSVYVDDTWPEWGVQYYWKGGRVVERMDTAKGTRLEMVHRPQWGLTCYMNGEIQSCVTDERLYHETLVHPAMLHTTASPPRRVLIIGGGEGATAREVLKWPSVEHIDMYEWDAEVIQAFQTRYRQWADGAWEDPRLNIHNEDIFSVVRPGQYPAAPYDVIIIDLFEPASDRRMWSLFSRLASDWLAEGGAMSMYAGIRNHWRDIHPAEEWLHPTRLQEDEAQHLSIPQILSHRVVYSYKVFQPSFLGEAMFLLLAPAGVSPSWNIHTVSSHLTAEIWFAYHTWNQYPGIVWLDRAVEAVEVEDTEGVRHGV